MKRIDFISNLKSKGDPDIKDPLSLDGFRMRLAEQFVEFDRRRLRVDVIYVSWDDRMLFQRLASSSPSDSNFYEMPVNALGLFGSMVIFTDAVQSGKCLLVCNLNMETVTFDFSEYDIKDGLTEPRPPDLMFMRQ